MKKLEDLRRKEAELQKEVYQRTGERSEETRRLLSELRDVQREISRLESQSR